MAPAPPPGFPGPDVLGRGAVVAPGAPAPPGFEGAARVRVDRDALAEPREAADRLHAAWSARERVVVELGVHNDELREPQTTAMPPWQVDPRFAFDRERLHFLVWANTYDCRGDGPVWWHGRIAERLGAHPGEDADVRLADGAEAWCDGGPREPLPATVVHRETLQLRRLDRARHRAPTEELAPDQLAAVTHPRGASRIIAPAGSGKTRVLTARLRHLLRDRGVEPEIVTAVAYNNRAAAEMRDRTADLADGSAGAAPNVRTIHSLGLWVCNLDRRRRTIDEREARRILSDLVTVATVPNQDPYAPYLEALAEVRLGLRDPVEIEEQRDDVDGFAAAFERYRSKLADEGALDFDEHIYGAIEVLLRRPDLRRRAQRACTHLLVDEFQDLTPAFVLLLRLLAAPAYQVFGVGDDDQVIYGYAGADPGFLIGYERLFPGAGSHQLEVNYRCPPAVVAAARRLVGHNRRRLPKAIRAAEGRAEDPTALIVRSAGNAELAERTVETVRGWLDGGCAPAALAVLARVNASLLAVQVACEHAGIPTTAPIDPSILRRTGIRTALAYLRIGLRPDRIARDDLLETIRRPSRRLPRPAWDAVRRRARWSLDDLAALADQLGDRSFERLMDYVDDVSLLADGLAAGADTAAALRLIRTRIGLGEAMDLLDGSRTRLDGSAHTDDLDALEQVAALHPDPAGFGQWLADSLRRGGRADGVTLSSIHRMKGREWDRVVVFAANAGLLPHRLSDDVEEERRVFHVAVTRCREEVVVLADRDNPSPFLRELHRDAPPRTDAPRDRVASERGARPWQRTGQAAGRAARATSSTGGEADPADPLTEQVFEALREWRSEIARAAGVPAYVVMNDAHLRGIAARRPGDLRALARCPGIGPVKLDRYGDDLLAILEQATA